MVSETPKVLTAAGKTKLGRFCERHGVTFLGVFGSVARGEAKADSDVDVIVQLSQPKSLLELVAMEDELSQLLNRKVDLLTEAAISPYLRERILAETVVLYEQAGR
ncbi:MAG: type VII toxin-antitoxin system MntA family adenylyltransferase antitoxin [Desulfotomaculales bacterium]